VANTPSFWPSRAARTEEPAEDAETLEAGERVDPAQQLDRAHSVTADREIEHLLERVALHHACEVDHRSRSGRDGDRADVLRLEKDARPVDGVPLRTWVLAEWDGHIGYRRSAFDEVAKDAGGSV
jgi:hypothetical protein